LAEATSPSPASFSAYDKPKHIYCFFKLRLKMYLLRFTTVDIFNYAITPFLPDGGQDYLPFPPWFDKDFPVPVDVV